MLWEKEKLPVTSNFSFSHGVFYPFGELSGISNEFKIVVCKLCQFGSVKDLSFGKGIECPQARDTLTDTSTPTSIETYAQMRVLLYLPQKSCREGKLLIIRDPFHQRAYMYTKFACSNLIKAYVQSE